MSDTLTTQGLAAQRRGVVFMGIAAAGGICDNTRVGLGVREGHGYRSVANIVVVGERSLSEPQVGEVELEPGDYHVIGYRCVSKDAKKGHEIADPADQPGWYRTSFASFSVQAGEIINVGYLQIKAQYVGRPVFGKEIRSAVMVTDWPLDLLDRFKTARPTLYAQMQTRLMQAGRHDEGPSAETCARLRTLKSEGKVATLPPACQGDKRAARP